ncbi:hypothetical protein [Flavobacterium sp. HSC-61S13]|uniref:hypothetical protein n=1 Tax=Flavobacterium sp. HSC-61S13 TaxID=2910963 RepID=UPI0020A1199E|nr:hypothetical protein [Flavobacterium sp. HSC-61S13]MCP1996748.1 putative nucleic acid-binding protein [Flavobacterium sp. HSC-61S13]
MKKKLLSVVFLLGIVATGYSQVGVGTQIPNESSQLDVVASNKGVLIPRVSLVSTTDETTISAGNVNSLLVFNTNTNLGAGYYYWMNSKWLRLVSLEDIEALPAHNTVNTKLSVNHTDSKLVLEDSDGNQVEVLLSEIFNHADFVTAITETHLTEIFNNQNVINEIITNLNKKYGYVTYNPVTKKFQYYNDDGLPIDIDWSDFNTTNESFTIVGSDLVITDTEGNTVAVALKDIFSHADFVTAITETHRTEIFNNQNVINEIITNLNKKYGYVTYNPVTKKFQYYNDDGLPIDIDWSDFNTTNESFTIVGSDLVITDTEGNTVAVALKDIFSHADFVTAITETHLTEIFNNQNVINEIITNLNKKYGYVIYNPVTKKFQYHDPSTGLTDIDWSDFNTTNRDFDVDDTGTQLVITDTDGATVQVDLEDIFRHIDFVTAITETHLTEIFNNQNVINQIITNLHEKYGYVVYNPVTNQFQYYNDAGVLTDIDWSDLNTTNQSFTIDGSDLVITDTAGNTVAVALKEIFNHADFVTAITETHLTEIFNNQNVINEIITNLNKKYGYVVYNPVTKKFQYYNDDGLPIDIDWSDFNTTNQSFTIVGSDLVITDTEGNTVAVALKDIFSHADFVTAITETHLTEIFNNQNVINEIITNLNKKYGYVIYNPVTNKLQYYNDDGLPTDIDWSSINTTNVSLTVDSTGEFLTLKDSDGNNVDVALASLQASRPWNKQNNTTPAVSYLEDIYQQGSVAVGTSVIPSLNIGGVEQDVKFHVAGNISTTGKLYTTNSVYADYVFENYFNGYSDINNNYEFKSLDYVKSFIAENNHLPGVTKISDLNKTDAGYSFDMTELSIQQLEKIEELFLHSIEQQDLIDRQEAEINQLKSESELMKERLTRLENQLFNSI